MIIKHPPRLLIKAKSPPPTSFVINNSPAGSSHSSQTFRDPTNSLDENNGDHSRSNRGNGEDEGLNITMTIDEGRMGSENDCKDQGSTNSNELSGSKMNTANGESSIDSSYSKDLETQPLITPDQSGSDENIQVFAPGSTRRGTRYQPI